MAKKTQKEVTMNASTMGSSSGGSLNVDSTLHLQSDGWELWSYDTGAAGPGFLIRDARQDPNKHRLEILYWQQDRAQNTQFVMDGETGNVGIGVIPSTARLEVNGTVKATGFAGSGAQITEIKATNITEGVLAVDRVPSLPADRIPQLDQLNGQLSVAKLSGNLPIERITGNLPMDRVSGNLPIDRTTGNLSIDRITGNWPLDRTTGNLPAARIDGGLSQWTTSGHALYYNGNIVIGASPVPGISDSDALAAASRAAANAQAVKAVAQSVGGIPSRNAGVYQNIAASIATAADAATAAVPGSGATTAQIAQAVVAVSQQLRIVDEKATDLNNRVSNESNELFAQNPVREGIPDAKGNAARRIAAQLSQGAGQLAAAIGNVERSRQELEFIWPALLARSLESNKLNVVGDSRMTGNINCWGDVVAKGSIHGANSDLAENYLSDLDLAAADVVCLDQHQDRIIPSDKPNDPLVIGVISSAPGFLLNATGHASYPSGTLAYPVALCGRVPCKVTDENGPILRGDLLTSSSTPGHAMKALPVNFGGIEIHRPGTIIGKALEAWPTSMGVIEVFVNLR